MSTNFNQGEQNVLSNNKITNKGTVIVVIFGGFGAFVVLLLLIGMVCFGILDKHTFAVFMTTLFIQTISLAKWVVIGLVGAAGLWFLVHQVVRPVIDMFRPKIHYANDRFMGYSGNMTVHDHKDEKNNYTWKGEIGQGEMLALPPPREDEIPHMIRYDDIRGDVPAGHTLLGVGRGKRLETRVFSVLDTCWICGGSKVGKTNTVSLKVDEAYELGYKFIVIDPHMRKPDSLYNAIRGYSDAFLMPVAMTYEGIEHALQAFMAEAKRRIAGGESHDKWILIVDETGSLTGDKGKTDDQKKLFNLLYNIARMCGQELRGFGMAGWFISQNAVGVSWLRAFAMTIIVHKLLMENERRVATNNNMAIVRDMDNWPRGRCLVHGLDIPEGQIVLQQPLFTPRRVVDADPSRMEDLYPNPLTTAYTNVSRGSDVEVTPQADGDSSLPLTGSTSIDAEKYASAEVGSDKREIIQRMAASKKYTLDEISQAVGLSGRKYPLFQSVCRELDIKKGK